MFEGVREGQLFSPPLWMQRRMKVSQILRKHNVQSVVDFGCGEGALLEFLLNDTSYSKLAGVDRNPERIKLATVNCQPTVYDKTYLRELPITLDLYVGSIADFDCRLCEYEAITSVEVVEHLDEETLKAFPQIVFGMYRPRLIVFTTPNAEPDAILRDEDHRFEWTRVEFREWATDLARRFGYTVEFSGVGKIRDSTEAMELPMEISESQMLSQHSLETTISFPYFEESGFSDEKILGEAMAILSTRIHADLLNFENERLDDEDYQFERCDFFASQVSEPSETSDGNESIQNDEKDEVHV
ncbi:hypothetical protein BC829DRAFT_384560 [Chytridium lagenaria]|nr:hypothetical protein BC829DRAFT_384560 [Chytridium lagenaria]